MAAGSSPRRRGTPFSYPHTAYFHRFIPAQAGNTMRSCSIWRAVAVHPRAGGEHTVTGLTTCLGTGSSPRRRGTLSEYGSGWLRRRFIPAQAGNTRSQERRFIERSVHPRAGGEHLDRAAIYDQRRGSSPRRRGTRPQPSADQSPAWFIPAQAGNTEKYQPS
ncbi:Hypothetical protein GbCGDNIH2_1369 [Granulibacter bethesdensis]|nr:Hypothetical protein GbCGDNIH2_1369 [Granulibacter bethesdensis]